MGWWCHTVKKNKKTPGSPDETSSCLLWTASLSWLVSAVWLRVKLWYATPGICAFYVFHVQIVWGEKTEGGKTGSLININIIICEGGREDLSGLAAFNPCCGAFLSLCLSYFLSSVFLCNFSDCCFNFRNIVNTILIYSTHALRFLYDTKLRSNSYAKFWSKVLSHITVVVSCRN